MKRTFFPELFDSHSNIEGKYSYKINITFTNELLIRMHLSNFFSWPLLI